MDYDKMDNTVKFYSIISYIGPLFILARVSKRRCNKIIDFHSWQGGILFFTLQFLNIAVKYITRFLHIVPMLGDVIGHLLKTGSWTVGVVLSVMGVVGAYKMEMKRLPVIENIDNILRNHYKYM